MALNTYYKEELHVKRITFLGFAVLLLLSTLILSGWGGGPTGSDPELITQTVNNFAQALVDADASRTASLSNVTDDFFQIIFLFTDYNSIQVNDLVISVNGSSATAAFNATITRTVMSFEDTQTSSVAWPLVKVNGKWLIDMQPIGSI